jgi:GT2 family glycosyltransferase
MSGWWTRNPWSKGLERMTDVGPRVHVLLPVHNRRACTERLLGCLRLQTYPSISLTVIDDGSTDGTAELVRMQYPDALIIRGNGNLWWAGALQAGLESLRDRGTADQDIVFILNNDTEFDAGLVARAVSVLKARPDILLAARRLDEMDATQLETGIHGDFVRMDFRVAQSPAKINCLPTRGLFLRWSTMRAIGDFHPKLLPHYWSDYEYTLRAHRLGFPCMTDPSVSLRGDMKTTGERDLDQLTGIELVKRLFSIRCPANPVYGTAFVLLAAPWHLKISALFIVWARSLARLVWQGALLRKLQV